MSRPHSIFILLLITFSAGISAAQESDAPRSHTNFVDFTLGVGSKQTNLSTSYQHLWKFGDNKRLLMGVGMRINGFFASDAYMVTAPAKIVKGETGPGALFKKSIPEYTDSVFMPTSQAFSVNFLISIAYNVSDDFRVGFNIDVIGASFGSERSGTYINGNNPSGIYSSPVRGAPTGLNLLLVGENDIGSLNSEFYVTYALDERWSLKGGLQHSFMEYTTTTKVQQFPEANDRFRITPTVACVGVVYTIH